MVSLNTYQGFPKCGVETATDLKILHDVFYKRYKVICVIDDDKWITTKGGHRVLIGENGEIKAGMGGNFNGQPLEATANAGEGTQSTAANTGERGTISPSGANEFKNRGFVSKKSFKRHIDEHLKEYPGLTAEQYEIKAIELLQKPVGNGILGYMDKAGKIVRYDTATNDLAAGYPEKGISTMYKPKDGQKLYDSERRRNLKNER